MYKKCPTCGYDDKSADPCVNCEADDHAWVDYTDPVHCLCCHLDTRPSKEEEDEAIASIRDALTRQASSRSVGSVTGQKR